MSSKSFEPAPVQSAADAELDAFERILLVGPTGSGKTKQIWTLPGRKFVYVFDPNANATLKNAPNCDIVQFMPEFLETDATLKGFNKDSQGKVYKGDSPATRREPSLYMRWVDDLNWRVENGFFKDYQWICFDSMTFLSKSLMDRQLYINNRYGGVEDIGDYKIVGRKLSDVFQSINSLPINVLAICHKTEYQDDLTKKIVTQIRLPGSARDVMPLMYTNVWLAHSEHDGKRTRYKIRTVPEPRGLQEIRSGTQGLAEVEDVTIEDNSRPERYGIGAILSRKK